MKRCPECRRDYFDDSLMYCLDDGSALLEGPTTADESVTAILNESVTKQEQPGRGFGSSDLEQVDRRPPGATRRSVKRAVWIAAAAVIILSGGLFASRYFSTAGTKQIESIAVMPFINDSGGADSDYLSDGMTEALISSLSNLPGISVKARSSVFRYKGKETAPSRIGNELNVQAVLNGRVAQHGDDLTLHLELIDAVTENVVWSERYRRKQNDIVELQSEIARDVSGKLARRFAGQSSEKPPTENAEAYQLYLQGRFHWNKRQKGAVIRAIEYFERAIEKDPRFALAYVGLAYCYIVANTYDVLSPTEAYPKAKVAVQKALELDDSLAEAYIALAAISEDYDWDWSSAERNYRKGISLKPNNSLAYQWYGEFLRLQSRHDESVAAVRKAVELDPIALSVNTSLGLTLYYAGRCADAIPQLQKTIELDPAFPVPYTYIGICYTLTGRHDDAIQQYQALIDQGSLRRSSDLALFAFSLAKAGRIAEAREVLAQLETKSKSEYVDQNDVAIAHYGLGELDATFAALALSVEQRSPGVRYIKVEPIFGDDLRHDPRYTAMLRKIGL